jgi:hypothetical protein
MDIQQVKQWQSDPEGRVRNISLAPSPKNALIPLFEAVMNSIHAIEERFGKDNLSKGTISIEMIRSDDFCVGFVVKDNGVGFTSKNLQSFITMDSSSKRRIGGKGVGRLLWLKVIDKVGIQSTYFDDENVKSLSFFFDVSNPVSDLTYTETPPHSDIGTVVNLFPYDVAYGREIPRKISTLANRVIAHFISYFINLSHPKIVITDQDESIDLFDQFSESIEKDKDFVYEILMNEKTEKFTLHCFLLPKKMSDDESSTNALYLGANGRAVRRQEMDKVIGMTAIDHKFACFAYVESPFLDLTANETRTDFSISEQQIGQIIDKAKDLIKEFLSPQITEIRKRQSDTIKDLRQEHPRFLNIAHDPAEFAEKLSLNTQNKEDIFVELSRQGLRTYERNKNDFRKSIRAKLPDIQEKAQKFVAGLKGESLSSLAEYVTKRKLVLETFEESLRYTNSSHEKTEYEKVIHDIICPLRTSTEELRYEDHNLWIIDDRLAFYTYFNSDIPMNRQILSPAHPKDRPDISIFDLGLGFQNDDASTPITIIEPPRVLRRPFHLSHAASFCSLSMA